jgi:predicted oxidoreductase
MRTRLATNQIELSLGRVAPFTDGDLAFLQERGIAPMAWSPLGGGTLLVQGNAALTAELIRLGAEAGVDPASVAVAWLLAHPAGILPVMGTNRLERIAKFSEALTLPMDRETWFELYSAALGHEVP